MFLPRFWVFRVGVRLVSRMGCPRPWEKRGLRLGLGMLVLTRSFSVPGFFQGVGVRLVSRVGCPRPWEKRGLGLGLGMLVLTHQTGFYSRNPGVGPNVPQLGGCFFRVGPIVVGVGYGYGWPWSGQIVYFGG